MTEEVRPLTVVIAPDSFKGTMTADEAARAIELGWLARRPADTVKRIPQADGGEGTAAAIAAAVPEARWHRVASVRGPGGSPVDGHWLELPGMTAVVEIAQMNGITLMDELDPDRASTFGFGETIADAIRRGARELLLCLGGSASNDGGAGAIRALGARLVDRRGRRISDGAAGLDDLHTVDLSAVAPPPTRGVTMLTDVTAPLLGPTGATAVFGPQKGIPRERLHEFENRLVRLARALPEAAPMKAGMGAAGGAAFGIASIWEALSTSGAAHVSALTGLTDAIESADVLVTGEGRYDDQSGTGKVVGALAALAARHRTPIAIIAGSVRAPHAGPVVDLSVLAGGSAKAMTDPVPFARRAGAELAEHINGAILPSDGG